MVEYLKRSIPYTIALVLVILPTKTHAADWWSNLRPGVSRSEIVALSGVKSIDHGSVDTYKEGDGVVECRYVGDELIRATVTTKNGTNQTYFIQNADTPENMEEREAYLKSDKLSVLPVFKGPRIYTNKYAGCVCYLVKDGFILVEPILALGGSGGFYQDKTAIVKRVGLDQSETVLYRAFDHWDQLKPPEVPNDVIKTRMFKLLSAGKHAIGSDIRGIFFNKIQPISYKVKLKVPYGDEANDDNETAIRICNQSQCDSFEGSGIFREIYYLRDGLAIVFTDLTSQKISKIEILRPGVETISLDQWLEEHH